MSASNQTTNYGLPLFVNTDLPGWLTDFNNAMNKIDEAIHEAAQNGGTDGTLKTINHIDLHGEGNISLQTPLTFDSEPTQGSTNPVTSSGLFDKFLTKQDQLVSSGENQNVKTVGGVSILGQGDIPLPNTPITIKTINNQPITGTGNIDLQVPLVGSGTGQNIKTVGGVPILGQGDIPLPTGGNGTILYESLGGNEFYHTPTSSNAITLTSLNFTQPGRYAIIAIAHVVNNIAASGTSTEGSIAATLSVTPTQNTVTSLASQASILPDPGNGNSRLLQNHCTMTTFGTYVHPASSTDHTEYLTLQCESTGTSGTFDVDGIMMIAFKVNDN